GRCVCTCFDIAEGELRTHFAVAVGNADAALREVQTALRCGTNCGSCLPELKRLAIETRGGAATIPAAADQRAAPLSSAAIAWGERSASDRELYASNPRSRTRPSCRP